MIHDGNTEFQNLSKFVTGNSFSIESKIYQKNKYKEVISEKANELLQAYYSKKNEDLFRLLGYRIEVWS
jgi:hypothetical protein